jgi:hypothetical protein
METPSTLNPAQAAQALKEAGAAERRSAEAYRYQRFSPYLLLWGVIWIAGYSGSDLWARSSGRIWLGLVALALLASIAIARSFADGRADPQVRWRTAAFFVVVWAFLMATYAIMRPVTPLQYGAFLPLLVAFAYVVLGLWGGRRLVITGVLVGALTLGGFFYLPQHFLLWEGFVGGGGLILAGLWFRRV